MIDFDINPCGIEGHYNFVVYVDNVSVNYGLVRLEDLVEILVSLKTTIDAEMEEIA